MTEIMKINEHNFISENLVGAAFLPKHFVLPSKLWGSTCYLLYFVRIMGQSDSVWRLIGAMQNLCVRRSSKCDLKAKFMRRFIVIRQSVGVTQGKQRLKVIHTGSATPSLSAIRYCTNSSSQTKGMVAGSIPARLSHLK